MDKEKYFDDVSDLLKRAEDQLNKINLTSDGEKLTFAEFKKQDTRKETSLYMTPRQILYALELLNQEERMELATLMCRDNLGEDYYFLLGVVIQDQNPDLFFPNPREIKNEI